MYVLGTAGHVDHGKSTLVKALTGIDPDRWAEEQRREMTIDLGFAWRTLPSGRTISLVDVPGHERFIKNMLAGVGGIDAALLVVAADESLMPQTEEHLAILDLLGIGHGLVVLTKADLVEADWLALVAEEVRVRLRETSLVAASIMPVSARSGVGLPELLAEIDVMLDATPTRTSADGSPRMSIDRAFTIGGFGAVVTGTLVDGPLRLGDEIEVLPGRLRARVRGLQTHQQKQDMALPGTRVAVNLAGISHHDMARGDVLVRPGAITPTMTLDVQVRLIHDLPHAIEQNAALELFVGAAQVLCRATLLDRAALDAGETGWLQLRLERPLAVAHGDRYILRQPSPGRTIGGGVIVDAHPPRHRRFRAEVIGRLAALARGTPADLLRPALADGMPHAWGDLLAASGLDAATAQEGAVDLLAMDEVVVLDKEPWRQEDKKTREQEDKNPSQLHVFLSSCLLVSTHGWRTLREKLAVALGGYHRRYPLRQGMPREDLRSRLKLGGPALDAVLAAASDLAASNERLAWSVAHQPALTDDQERAARRLLDGMKRAPYSPPAPDLDPELLAFLLDRAQIVRVSDEVCFAPAAYAEMTAWVRAEITRAGNVTVAQFRDRFSTSRKYALALLEHLDERKVTRREGEARVLC